jgi:short subunit fatty acids transporter
VLRNKVHITQGDHVGKAVIVSWVTMDEPGSSTVNYWSENNKEKKQAQGKVVTYKFFNYISGFIHHTTIRKLKVTSIFHAIVSLDCSDIIPLFLFCSCSVSIGY